MSVLREIYESCRVVEQSGGDNANVLLNLPLDGETIEQRAANLLNRLGCRQRLFRGSLIIGYWPDLDGPELRAALAQFYVPPNLVSIEGITLFERRVPLRQAGEPLSRWLKRTCSDTGDERPPEMATAEYSQPIVISQ